VSRRRGALACVVVGSACFVGGVAVIAWPAALILGGMLLAGVGLMAIDVDGDR